MKLIEFNIWKKKKKKNNINEKDNIYDNIFENKQFGFDEDFIFNLSQELEEKFIKYLTRFIVNSEKETILSSLSKDYLPKCAKKMWEKALDEFNFSKKVKNDIKSNKIKICTKLNLPSINYINQKKK